MILINCPNCGPRNVQEFRFGGEVKPRPSAPHETDDDVWSDYIFMKSNRLGTQQEWWYHRAGCQQWFLAERDTGNNHVSGTRRHEP